MKKLVYTLSFLTIFTLASKAQAPSAAPQQEPKKEAVSPDKKTAQPSAAKKDETAPGTAPRTRMAINEKGVPASKASSTKDKKEEKATATPGQPAEKH